MSEENFIKLISCPVTKKLFCTPVLASDNCVYEAEVAYNLIENKIKSPITGKILKKDIKVPIQIKSLVEMFICSNKEFEEHRYKSGFDIKKVYNYSKAEILTIFTERKNYSNLCNYDSFEIEDIDCYRFNDFLRYAPSTVIIHFLDHCNNLEYKWNENWSLINYVCKNCHPQIVKHMLNKYPNLNYENESSNGWRPVHQLASLDDGECVRMVLDLGVNLFTRTNEHITGLEYILAGHDRETILYALGKVEYLQEDLPLAFLMIRLDDNEKIDEQVKDEIRLIMISKFNC